MSETEPLASEPSESEVQLASLDGVATITLNRPDALNAITPTMLGELNAALDTAEADPSIHVVVLTGAGRAFSAGVDLKALGDRELTGGSVGDILDLPARAATAKLSEGRLVSIAKVNGFCFTGALELALACDLMVCAEGAKMADTHAKFGLRPTWGLSARLPSAVGMAKARELSYTARTFTGAEAESMGMACRAVASEELDAVTAEMASAIAANSMGSLAAYKDLYTQAESTGVAEGLVYETATSYGIGDTEERLAGFRS
ncbi:MAG: enoyl-CoA hydratase/isomerase family protein [Actinomycetota bacterium]